ncbi:MAG: hypothetical protein R2774_06325 [Saprospiraceae bacterium]
MQIIKYFIIVNIWFLILFMSSCATTTQFQTAKPTGKGNISSTSVVDIGSNFKNDGYIMIEAIINRGITENLDFVSKINTQACVSLGAKYTFFVNRDSTSFIAVGPSLNYNYGTFNATLPLYITYNLSDKFSFTITPSFTSPGAKVSRDIEKANLRDLSEASFGLSPYFELGRNVKFVFGGNFNFSSSNIYVDFGIGIKLSPPPKIFSRGWFFTDK